MNWHRWNRQDLTLNFFSDKTKNWIPSTPGSSLLHPSQRWFWCWNHIRWHPCKVGLFPLLFHSPIPFPSVFAHNALQCGARISFNIRLLTFYTNSILIKLFHQLVYFSRSDEETSWLVSPYHFQYSVFSICQIHQYLSNLTKKKLHGNTLTFRRGDKLAVWRRSGAAKQILGKIEPAFFRCILYFSSWDAEFWFFAFFRCIRVFIEMWNSLKKEPFLYIAQCRHCMKLMQERHGGKGKRCWTFTNNHISSTPNTKKAQIRLASTSLNKFFTQLYKTFTRVVFIVTSDNPGWARNHLGGRWLLNEQDIFKRKCHWFGEKNMGGQWGFSWTHFVFIRNDTYFPSSFVAAPPDGPTALGVNFSHLQIYNLQKGHSIVPCL